METSETFDSASLIQWEWWICGTLTSDMPFCVQMYILQHLYITAFLPACVLSESTFCGILTIRCTQLYIAKISSYITVVVPFAGMFIMIITKLLIHLYCHTHNVVGAILTLFLKTAQLKTHRRVLTETLRKSTEFGSNIPTGWYQYLCQVLGIVDRETKYTHSFMQMTFVLS